MQTLEQAAISYHKDQFGIARNWQAIDNTEIQRQQQVLASFKAGAEWQKNQYKQVSKAIQIVLSCLQNAPDREYEKQILTNALKDCEPSQD